MLTEPEVIIERMADYEIRLYQHMSAEHQHIYFNLRQKLDEYVLDFLAMNIRDFTSHGKRHFLGVVCQLSNLITDDMLPTMTSVEVFILLCGAWLHDIGLLVNRDKKGNQLSDTEIREQHHELSAWKIGEVAPRIGLENPNLVRLMGDIYACHRRSVEISKRLPQSETSIQQQRVRSHLLAALLRMADALDTDYHRAPQFFEQIGHLSNLAKLHWRICQMIELDYRPAEARIHLNARYSPESELSEEDARDLIRSKFSDLYTEWDSVQDIFEANKIPYSGLTASLTLSNGHYEELNKEALTQLEILPLDIIYCRRNEEQCVKQNQFLHGAYWDYQAARLCEKRATKSSKGSRDWTKTLQQTKEFYERSLVHIRAEIQNQPPERYFLWTLERFYMFKRVEVDDCLNSTDTLSIAQRLFLQHIGIIQKALPQADTRTHLRMGKPWSEFDDDYQTDFKSALQVEPADPDHTWGHLRCCSCVAERAMRMTLARFDKQSETLLQWLRTKRDGQWRTIGETQAAQEDQRTFRYTARVLRAFTEVGDIPAAHEVASVLVENRARWLEKLEEPSHCVLADILQDLAFYLRRSGRNFGDPAFSPMLARDGLLYNLVLDLANAAAPERVLFVNGLILWREVPDDVSYQEQGPLHSLREQMKRLVCRTIQRDIIEDPLWGESRGSWTYNAAKKVSILADFWEYYLAGDDLEDFSRLAGITEEQGNVQ